MLRKRSFRPVAPRAHRSRTRRTRLHLECLEDRTQPATLALSLANAALVENGPPTTALLTRTGDLSRALAVAVADSDTTEASAPASVTIPAGQASASFTVAPVDDTVVDGTQPVTLTATAVTGPLTVGLDATFGPNHTGIVDTPALTGGSSTNPGDVLVLPDGKIVAAASTNGLNGWAVQWLNPDGTTIVTAYTAFPGATEPGTAYAIARQADGKILVAGDTQVNGVTDWAVARYNADGTLDFTFNNSGTLVLPHGGYDSIYDLQVEADGNILVAGFWYFSSEFRVTRISPTGGVLGSATVPVYQAAPDERVLASVSDMAVGPDGTIVLTGTVDVQFSSTGALKERFGAAARLNADLTPDTTFGTGGSRTLTGADFGAYAQAGLSGVEVLADGRVVVGGTVWGTNQTNGQFAAARFNPDGTLDTSFAGDGTATLSLAGGGLDDAEALALAVQPDGKLVLGGDAWRSQNGPNQALARFNPDGTPDTHFNGTGFFVAADYPTPGSFEKIHAIGLQPDGELVAQAGGGDRQWVARFDMATGETLTATANLTVADDDPSLTLSVSPAAFGESAGANAATGTVTRVNSPLTVDLVVTLSSSDTTEATVPATVTIPAGQASATFPVAAVDDTVPDGTQAVTLTATASGLSATASVSVTDDEPPGPAVAVTIDKTGVLEQTGANAATGTVTRYGFPLDQALTVSLSSSDTTEATVPATVTIPAGQASATFAVATVDDTFADGTQAVTITASATPPALTGPITYDTTWGPNSGWQYGFVHDQVAVAPDGKLVVAGTYGTVGTNADFGIYRYNTNGTADTTFGTSGRVQLNPVGPSDQPEAVLVQPDGKIIVAGFGATSVTAQGEMVIVRLRTNGTLDGFEFGTGGIVRLTVSGAGGDSISDAALQPDGKILLSGTVGGNFGVVRLNADGSLDTSFHGTGWVATTLSSPTYNRAYAVAVAPDGKVVAAGVTGQDSAATSRIAVVRYNPDGTPDTSFGPGGVRETDVAGTSYAETGTDVVVQPDGKVMVAATLRNSANGSYDFAALRFNSDGTLDAGFGAGGIVTEAAASAYGGTTRVILQTDGRIVVAGTTGTFQAGNIRGRFLRLSPAGVLENRNDSAWTTSTTQSVAQDAVGNLYLAYNYGSSGTSGYVDRYRTLGAPVSGTARLNVLDNEPFAAVGDTYAATEETVLTVSAANGVRTNDTVTAPLSVRAELVAGPVHGTLGFNADGSFTYTPAANFFGTDGFTYRLRDGIGVTNPANVTINVANVNDAPVAVNDAYTTAEDTPLTVSAAAAQTSLTMVSDAGDYIGQGRTYNLSPLTGTFTVTGNTTYLTVRYQNSTNSGDYWYLEFRSPFDNVPLTPGTYLNAERAAFRTVGRPGLEVWGNGRGSNTLTGQFTILQIETSANGTISRFAADFEQHSEGTTPALRGSLRFNYTPGAGPGLLANDSDPDRDPLQVVLVAGPAHGQLALNQDGTFTYTPAPDYNGSDSFQYQASDGTLLSNVATVNLTVTAVNDPPVTRDDAATTAEDAAATIDVVANDSDVEGTALKPTLVSQPAHGTATVNAANQVVYTPAANFFGTDTFTYKATEAAVNGLSGNVATVTVTVTPVPDPPVAVADSYTTDQGVTLSVNLDAGVLANDSDPDGDVLTAAVATVPANGVLTLNADGSFTYAPDPAFYGTDSFTYTADDGTGRTATATVTLTVLRTNDPPVAQDDAATTNEDTQVGIAVIANDSDPNGDPIQAVVYTPPANGTAAYSPNDGRIYYLPAANWSGTDTFTYRAYDGRAYSAPATVTVTVLAVNDAPVARNDAFSVYEDTTLTVTLVEQNRPYGVLANDTDAENDPLTAVLDSGPANGTLTFNSDGSFTYTPNANFNGTDTFRYHASDGQLPSGVATVTITVYPVNDPPVGNPDVLNATEDTTLNIVVTALTGNDTDPDGDVLSIGDITQPANGTLTRAVTYNGLIYRPNPNFNGTDTFTYRPLDRAQVQGNVTTVTINVAAVNDAPVGVADAYTTVEDTALTVPSAGVLANDRDVENDPLSAVLVTGPANGTLSLSPSGGFTYTPRANYAGKDSFTYRPYDGQVQGNTVTVSLTITPVNDAPVAAADSYTVAEDHTLSVAAGGSVLDQQALGGGQEFNAGAAGINWQQGVKAGVAGVLASFDLFLYSGSPGVSFDVYVNKGAPYQADTPDFVGRLTVTSGMVGNWVTVDVSAANIQLAAGEDFTIGTRNGSGADAFLLGAQDTNGTNYAPGRVYYNGTPYPAGASYSYDLKFRTRMRAPGGVLANDTDVDGDTLTAVLVAGPAHGTLSLAADGGFTYTPAANYNGPDAFTYKANDGTLDSNVVTVSLTVTPVDDAPVGVADSYTTAEDTPVSGNVLANDTDVEGDPLTAVAVGSLPAGLTLNPDGTFTYAPPANFNGAVSFQYKPNDGTADGNVVTVSLTVTPVNDAPVGVADAYTIGEDTGAGGNVLVNDTDVDGDNLTAELLTRPAHGQLGFDPIGSFAYAPDANFFGTDSFTYRPFDGQLYGAPVTVTITVTPVNDPPVAGNDTATTPEDTAVTVAVLANDADVENDPLAVAAVTQGANGAVTFTAAGVTYTPVADFYGTDSFTYTVSDGNGGAATGTVTVTVSPVNDPPTLAALGDLTILEDAGSQTVNLAGISAGPNESQPLTVTATSSNPGLIPNLAVAYTSPAATGALTFAPAANANGTAVVSVTVSDGSLSVTRQFTLTVTPVNDAPTTTGLAPVTMLEDAAATNVALTGSFADVEDGPAGLTYAVVGNTNPALFGSVTVAGGVLRLAPAANANGSAVLTVRATDTGGLSVQTTLALTVTAVNDAPSFTAGANQTVTAGSGPKTVAGWAMNISAGPADEAGQGLTFVVTTTNPALFVALPAVDPATGALTFIPEASVSGTATVTVVLRDDGGTANGGADASAARTFTITVNPNGLPTTPGVQMVGGEVIITGADTADTVTVVQQSAGKVKVTATLNGKKYNNVTFVGVTRVRVDTKGGNDTVNLAGVTDIPTWTDAGAGDDSVTGGGGADAIYLGDGNDTADGGAGDDFVAGGAGKDLIQGGSGNDTLYGGDNDDFVIGGAGVDLLFGQAGNDILVGGSATVRNPSTDSLRKVLTDWNPASTGVGGYADLRNRLVITDDGVADRLRGDAGTDWFWVGLSSGVIDDLEAGEQRN